MNAYDWKIWYVLPLLLSSKLSSILPDFTGLSTRVGLMPEKSRIGARISMMIPKAKQKPTKNFSLK